MKKLIIFTIVLGILLFVACELSKPTQPEIEKLAAHPNKLLLTKMVAIGNSITAGFQSAGLVEDFQKNSYPYLIAKQMWKEKHFELPWIAEPGISSTPGQGALKFENGQIVPRGNYTNPLALLKNAELSRPYDDLGVPGADLNDVLNTVDGSGGNPFFDLILRNPNFANMTVVEQAIALNPTLILLWIGNNDVLDATVDGGDLSQITSQADFQQRFTELLTELSKIHDGKVGIIMANIPNITDIPYVNLLDGLIYKTIAGFGTLPVVFDTQFQPVDFDTSAGGELYIPLLTEENALTVQSPVQHVLLPFLSEYQANGLGVPDSAALVPLLVASGVDPNVAPFQAQALVQGMMAAGLQPSGVPIPANLTITEAENDAMVAAVTGFNQVLSTIATSKGIPLVDINAAMNQLNTSTLDGYSGKFVFFDPQYTAFSLDGIHPNNGGQALIANMFINAMNQIPGIDIPLVDPAPFKGQYAKAVALNKISPEAAQQIKALFVR